MFIDDTRNVDNEATNDPRRRFASITGVIFAKDYYVGEFEPRFIAMRERHFGLTTRNRPPILHRHNIVRKEGPFSCLKDPEREQAWKENSRSLYTKAEYKVITCSINKIAYYHKYPRWTDDIYHLLVQTAVERYFFFLQSIKSTGDVLAERRGKRDIKLKERYRETLDKGTGFISASDLNRHLSSNEIKIKPESDDICGLQMADLLASTSFSHCQRIYAEGRGPIGFSAEIADILESDKYHRDKNNDPHRFGRVWRP
ncbi:DUF3800 domain-containing protein [Pikeienuella sp. HZG-20]|uniref:DUF3800 domain-containing protein n=1 Tax=Paludibacillus litoralis TaxID=3133267 RepID=UPI0030EF2584